jgi:hypothetical protein
LEWACGCHVVFSFVLCVGEKPRKIEALMVYISVNTPLNVLLIIAASRFYRRLAHGG